MSENDIELKEDFSGFTEVTARDNTESPPKIDVSEAVEKAQIEANTAPEPILNAPDDESSPQLPGAGPSGPSRGMIQGMLSYTPPKPSIWQTLMNRGLTILAVVAVGVLAWWWWSKNSNTGGPVELAEAAVDAARKTVVEPIKKALKLPPNL